MRWVVRLGDQSQEPRWYWPRVFLRCTSGRLGQSITLTETLAFVCWIKGSQYTRGIIEGDSTCGVQAGGLVSQLL